ncbi:hypothetical protein BKA66DRAFT_577526 [Pyrenochaeta sp. MPI-SDFR-AT-0127]|nr:hypothetical protein BKA66DRAFT_577526 [Pyrenochaeta sp. MPI-SDFR-AT-0127]
MSQTHRASKQDRRHAITNALTKDQQRALWQLAAVTDQQDDEAALLLQHCEWNVQVATERFFEDEAMTMCTSQLSQSNMRLLGAHQAATARPRRKPCYPFFHPIPQTVLALFYHATVHPYVSLALLLWAAYITRGISALLVHIVNLIVWAIQRLPEPVQQLLGLLFYLTLGMWNTIADSFKSWVCATMCTKKCDWVPR